MQEIELSSGLYKENDALYMTVNIISKSDMAYPKSDALTLILTKNNFNNNSLRLTSFICTIYFTFI